MIFLTGELFERPSFFSCLKRMVVLAESRMVFYSLGGIRVGLRACQSFSGKGGYYLLLSRRQREFPGFFASAPGVQKK